MSSTATAATARRITATAKAAVSASLGARFTTSSQGPYSFRVVLRGVEANPSAELSAAGLAVLAIRGLDEGARFTATWGRARNRQVVITVTDETAREASIAEQGAAREAAMQKALAERPAEPGPDGGELRYDEHGARFWTAEELAAEKAQQEQPAEPELRSIGTDLYEVVRGGQAAGRVSLLGHGWYGYDLTGAIRTGCYGGPDTAAAALADAAPGITPDSPAGGDTCGECSALIVKRWHADGGGSHWGHADPALDGHPAPAQDVLVQQSSDAWAALSLEEREELRAEGLRELPLPGSPALLSREDSEAAHANGFSYAPEHGSTRAVIVREGSPAGRILGRVVLLIAGGRPEFAAYREDGSRVGYGADRLTAAQLLRA